MKHILIAVVFAAFFYNSGLVIAGQPVMKQIVQGKGNSPRAARLIIPKNSGYSSVCGNRAVEDDEECDDGNKQNGDGCSCACAWEPDFSFVCGNGICEPGEGRGQVNVCARDCIRDGGVLEARNEQMPRPHGPPRCGDCIVDYGTGETCDDGNRNPSDECDNECHLGDPRPPICGNGRLEVGEECDDGNYITGDGCNRICRVEAPVCGNGRTESGEECDDGNAAEGDGCDSMCKIERQSGGGGSGMACEWPAGEPWPEAVPRSYPGALSMYSNCISPTVVRYAVCYFVSIMEFGFAVDNMSCPSSAVCLDGACLKSDSAVTMGDFCEVSGAGMPGRVMCPAGTRCAGGRCVPVRAGCTCSRTEASGTNSGFVTGTDCLIQHDVCVDDRLERFACGTAGTPEVASISTCLRGCRDGLCL